VNFNLSANDLLVALLVGILAAAALIGVVWMMRWARWRTVDIVVVSALAVAFGVVFWFWNTYVWIWLRWMGEPWEYAIAGVWVMPAVVAPLVVRKQGAAIYAEIVAAVLSVILGSQWGLDTLLSGFVQGAGAEIIFGFTLYKSYGPLTALLAGAGAGAGMALHDIPVYFPTTSGDLQTGIAMLEVVSCAVVAGVGGWLLVRALRRTGALQSFASAT
jgi:energy-coupling factor transport system substrate-specific component